MQFSTPSDCNNLARRCRGHSRPPPYSPWHQASDVVGRDLECTTVVVATTHVSSAAHATILLYTDGLTETEDVVMQQLDGEQEPRCRHGHLQR